MTAMTNILSSFFRAMRRSKELRRMAREAGLCDQWHSKWRDYTSQDDLLDMYIRGIDFCIKHDYPSLEYAKENFSSDRLHSHGIYIDEWVSMAAAPSQDRHIAVLLGKSMVTGETSPDSCVTAYVRHNSMMNISSPKNARLFIHAYDNAEISIGYADQLSRVFIYAHSPSAKILIEHKAENIKVRQEY